jgi:hypothetical protein
MKIQCGEQLCLEEAVVVEVQASKMKEIFRLSKQVKTFSPYL